jgi:hypothetical protein
MLGSLLHEVSIWIVVDVRAGWVRAMHSISTAAFNADTAPPTMIRAGGSSEMRFDSEVLFTNPPG